GQDLGLVGLLALGHDLALARPAAVQVDREHLGVERDARRAAVDDHDVSGPVRFARRGDPERLSETVAWHAVAASGLGAPTQESPRNFAGRADAPRDGPPALPP